MSKSLLDLDALQRQLGGALAGAAPGDAFTEAVVITTMHLAAATRASIDAVEHAHEAQLRSLTLRIDRLEELAAHRRATA